MKKKSTPVPLVLIKRMVTMPPWIALLNFEISRIALIFVTGISIGAEAAVFGFGGVSWQENVQLHDGKKILVDRRQSYGGRHEIGQTPPIKEQEITFTLPGTIQRIAWKTEYSEDVGRSNFILLALHILNDTPYIVAEPHLCLSYSKWGRPNPPYVFFKYENKAWKRIPLQEFPVEFKDINLVISTKTEEKTITAQSPVSTDLVKKLNSNLRQPEYRAILREPMRPEPCPQYSSGPKAPIPIPPKTKVTGVEFFPPGDW